MAEAKVEGARAKVDEVRSGIKRAEADVSRWQSEYGRVEGLVRDRAMTGGLLDETRNKLHASEAGRDEVKAQVHSAEAAVVEAKALLDKARSDLDLRRLPDRSRPLRGRAGGGDGGLCEDRLPL